MPKRMWFRFFLLIYAPLIPFHWVFEAFKRMVESDPLSGVYRDWWWLFKTGEKI